MDERGPPRGYYRHDDRDMGRPIPDDRGPRGGPPMDRYPPRGMDDRRGDFRRGPDRYGDRGDDRFGPDSGRYDRGGPGMDRGMGRPSYMQDRGGYPPDRGFPRGMDDRGPRGPP